MFENVKDFYPTPEKLINKMLSCVDFNSISGAILEPSAGSGALAKALNNKLNSVRRSRYDGLKMYDIDCIEIEPQLQHILRGENFRVVHDDFLSYKTMKNYSLIFANFPFSAGSKHALKAIEMLENSGGGQLVGLINAETLKNSYSANRQELLYKIEKHNGHIEYIQDGFLDADRKTGVEVALINVHVKSENKISVILDGLKQEEQHHQEHTTNNELIDGDYIKGIIQQYNYEVKGTVSLINEYMQLKPLMSKNFDNTGGSILNLSVIGTSCRDEDLVNEAIKRIRYKYWSTFLASENIAKMLTDEMRQAWNQKLDDLTGYDFSEYNILQIKYDMSKSLMGSIDNTIIKLFDDFTYTYAHSSENKSNIWMYNGWKTNTAKAINKRKIIQRMNMFDSYDGHFTIDYYAKNKLMDIEKVFNYLASGTIEDEGENISDVLSLAKEYGIYSDIECRYFTISFKKKGTAHLVWKYPELIDKLNIAGALHYNYLFTDFGKRPYENMTQEEKKVVNSFCGENKYKDIVKDKSKYLFDSKNSLIGIAG